MRIALCQSESRGADVPGNLDRLALVVGEAAAMGADLVVFPEMYLTGYNIGADHAAALAESADGASAARVSQIARDHATAVIYGFTESSQDRVYNAIRFVGRDGRQLALHRKTHLFGTLDRAMVAESDIMPPVVSFDGWNIGLAICYEVEFPEFVRALAVAGVDLLCVPTANMADYAVVQTVLLPARAVENQIYLAYANFCGAEGDIEYGGLSRVIAPSGEVIESADNRPRLLIADIDRGALDDSRRCFPYLADRRPAMYRSAGL